MPNYRRSTTTGATWFFTVNLLQRHGNDLLVRRADLLNACIVREQKARPFSVKAWVVLPEHMHCIWTLPEGDADFSTRWRRIKTLFSLQLPKTEWRSEVRVRRGERAIWQRRYWEHQIRDDRDFQRHADYIHFNPVKHGWVKSPADWPHSSFRDFVAAGLYEMDWAAAEDATVPGDE